MGGWCVVYIGQCVITDVREKQIMNAKSDKNRHQNYVVHQFGYVHGRERENILL